MVFTATVKKGEVVIRDVPLADGEVVEVFIEQRKNVYIPTPEEERELLAAEAEIAAGDGRPAHEFFAELRARDAARGRAVAARGARRGARKAKMGAARPRPKSASGRGRSRG